VGSSAAVKRRPGAELEERVVMDNSQLATIDFKR
jgi:hypothetical protein